MLRDIRKNPLMLTDCYNTSHEDLKPAIDFEGSHIYNRSTPIIAYGLQENILEILSIKIQQWMLDEAVINATRMNIPFPAKLWQRVIDECDGCIPLKVQAVPEGTYCPINTPYAQIRNVKEGFGDLVTWLEGIIMHSYFPSALAMRALNMRNYLESLKEKGYGDEIMIKFHSFGFRGHRSLEDAYWASTAWSMFLAGTDDFHIAQHLPNTIPVGSISALAHKVVMTFDDEYECYIHAIDKTSEKGFNICALVIDTYDPINVIETMVERLCAHAVEKNVHLVFRPDSGDLVAQAKTIYNKVQGKYTNASVIIGEGMSFEKAKEYDAMFEEAGIPLNFISYGIGAGFYKDIERDTTGHAMKTCFANGKPRMKLVRTNPFKQSIPNYIHLTYNDNGEMIVMDGDGDGGIFETIYEYDDVTKSVNQFHAPDSNHFERVRSIALEQKLSQERIVLSQETLDRIEAFKAMY